MDGGSQKLAGYKNSSFGRDRNRSAVPDVLTVCVLLSVDAPERRSERRTGIQIMGDVPFYVGVDSVDVWAGKQNFLLDEDGRPSLYRRCAAGFFQCDRAEIGQSDL